MRILFYFIFFIFVQIIASQYALAKPSHFYTNTSYKKQVKNKHHVQANLHHKHIARLNELRRREQHERLVASLREAKRSEKKQTGNLLPSFDDQGASVSGGKIEKIIISEHSESNGRAPTSVPEESLDDESSGW